MPRMASTRTAAAISCCSHRSRPPTGWLPRTRSVSTWRTRRSAGRTADAEEAADEAGPDTIGRCLTRCEIHPLAVRPGNCCSSLGNGQRIQRVAVHGVPGAIRNRHAGSHDAPAARPRLDGRSARRRPACRRPLRRRRALHPATRAGIVGADSSDADTHAWAALRVAGVAHSGHSRDRRADWRPLDDRHRPRRRVSRDRRALCPRLQELRRGVGGGRGG